MKDKESREKQKIREEEKPEIIKKKGEEKESRNK